MSPAAGQASQESPIDVLEVSEARTGESVKVGNISIDKFRDGNYDVWAYAVRLWMENCGIWHLVDPAGPVEPEQEPVWKNNEILARRIMMGTVTNRYAGHTRRAPTGRDTWIAIRSELVHFNVQQAMLWQHIFYSINSRVDNLSVISTTNCVGT